MMDPPLVVARHFSNLVWLLLHEPGSAYEQQSVLDSLAEAAKGATTNLAAHDDGLRADGVVVPASLTGVADLSRQMDLHGLAMISIDAGAVPADLFGVAGIIASMPVVGDGGAAADEKRREIGVRTVRFAARPRQAGSQTPRETVAIPLPNIELGDIFEDPLAEARANATPRSTQSINAFTPPRGNEHGLFAQFSAPRKPVSGVDALLAELDKVSDGGNVTLILSDLAVYVEDAAHNGKSPPVARILAHMVRREAQMEDFEAKRAFAMTLHRLSKSDVLRVLAAQIGNYPDDRADYVAALTRAGENGADALIEQLGAMSHQRDRHLYIELLRHLKAGVPQLLHMLRDGQWFVARNAAELLGELGVREAEAPLTDLLNHEDERVRRTAVRSLMRLGTTRALHAIEEGLKSTNPQMRIDAAGAMASRKDDRAMAALLRALDAEKDEGAHVAMLAALGKIASAEAIGRLLQSAGPDRSMFKKKPTAIRVAATHALAETGSPAGLELLRALQSDKDPDVRAAATGALGRVTRRATTSVRPVNAP